MRAFLFDGETSFEGLDGWGGVLGPEIGGAFRGERCFVGVGELGLVSTSSPHRVSCLLDQYTISMTRSFTARA